MDTAELIRRVRKVEIKTRGLARNVFYGGYHSAFKGRGMSFSEVRQYQFGDDVRSIDWNVTARTGDPHIKIFEEERELTVLLIVDISGSAFFGTGNVLRQEFITEVCAALAFSADANNDRVGLLLFSDKVDYYLPPQKGRQHTLRILRELLNVQPNNRGTSLAGALGFARNVLRKRSVCFILSDFWTDNYEQPLRVMAQRHDVTGIHCWDSLETSMPDVGLLCTRDAETGALNWIDTSDRNTRAQYAREFGNNRARTASLLRKAGADYLGMDTRAAYGTELMHFFEKRAKR